MEESSSVDVQQAHKSALTMCQVWKDSSNCILDCFLLFIFVLLGVNCITYIEVKYSLSIHAVIPVMTFEASDKFVHIGDTFDLSCTLSGFPTNFSRITSKLKGEQLPHHMQKQMSPSVTKSYVPVFEPEGNVYVCEAEVYFMEQLLAQYREEVTVDVYGKCCCDRHA